MMPSHKEESNHTIPFGAYCCTSQAGQEDTSPRRHWNRTVDYRSALLMYCIVNSGHVSSIVQFSLRNDGQDRGLV